MGRDWNDSPKNLAHRSGRALTAQPGASDPAVAASISATMADVVRAGSLKGPSSSMLPPKAEAPAVRGSGWRDEKPLESPMAEGSSTQRAIDAMLGARPKGEGKGNG